MRKLLFATSAAILALSIASCDSLPFLGGGGGEEATPEASPSPTAETPASPTPTPTPFASPDVPQKAPGAPALIQSSNPDERVARLEQEVGGSGQTQTSTPPTTLGTPPGRDPFSGLDIPIPAQSQEAIGQGTPRAGAAQRGGTIEVQTPDLAKGQVPALPPLPELTRPPQVGGTRLVGDVPPIRLSPLAESVINEFRIFQQLLSENTTYSDYVKDLTIIGEQFEPEEVLGEPTRESRRNSVRRQLLLTNEKLYRRLEKVLQEYVFALRLWDTYYSQSNDPDTVRCSSIPAIERAIKIYQAPTVRRGQLLCATRINLLGSIWQRAENILEAALRDSDFNAPSLADIPSLADAGQPTALAQLPVVRPFEAPSQPRSTADIPSLPNAGAATALTQLPVVPPFEAPSQPRSIADIPSLPDAGEPITLTQLPVVPSFEAPSQPRSIGLGPGPVEAIPEIPSIAIEPRGVPNLPELPVQDPPPRDPSARQEPVAGGGEPAAPPPPPPPPSTDLAEGVKVTGVVEVGSEKQVIIEAPNEATSRYVKVGQRVAGGKVLVKRVDFENGEAIVILEENDVEIRKIVGEEPAVE